jgi:hypothetical protein
MNCGPSGPWGRTVRPKRLKRAQNLGSSILGVQNELRTVRSMGADGPPPTENSGQKHYGFCVCSLFELRTVRPWGADSPPVTSKFSQRRLQIGWFEVLNRGQSAPGARTVRPGLQRSTLTHNNCSSSRWF